MKAAWQAGQIGSCQVQRLARAHPNVRVRHALIDAEEWFLGNSMNHSYREFDLLVTQWVSLADTDGARDTNEQNHHNRKVRLVQQFDESWRMDAACGALDGAELHSILDKFVEAGFLTDWHEAREDHGPDATVDLLARNASQRRFDALLEIFRRAATSGPDGGGTTVVTNVLIDQATFERALAELAGASPTTPPDPCAATYRCSTIDGAPLDPTECYWPGCHVPTSQCQADHLTAWADPHRGATDQSNGGSACGRHNRHKQGGFRVFRDTTGAWHVLRPDGTEID